MDIDQASADHCAECRHPLEIVTVRFSLAGAEVILACPNCATIAKDSTATRRESDDGAHMTVQAEATRIDTQGTWRRLNDSFPNSHVR